MSSATELWSIIAELCSEVTVGCARRENEERMNQEAVVVLQRKQRMAESRAAEFRATLQTKDEQLSKLTQTMSTMLDKIEVLQAEVVSLETRAPQNPDSLLSTSFLRETS